MQSHANIIDTTVDDFLPRMHTHAMTKSKRKATEKPRHLQVRVSPRLYMQVDHARGKLPRQAWVTAAIEAAIKAAP